MNPPTAGGTISLKEWLDRFSTPGASSAPVWIYVITGSMKPLIRPFHDKILMIPVSPDQLKVGDIVIFPLSELPGRYALHRLYIIEGETVQTLGDACNHPDKKMEKAKIFAKAVMIRHGSWMINCEAWHIRCLGLLWMRLYRIRPFLRRIYHVCRIPFQGR